MNWKDLTPKTKKAIIYGGVAAVGLSMVGIMTMTTTTKEKIKEPDTVSLTGNVDTRAVSIEGLNRRLAEMESGKIRESLELRNEINQMKSTLDQLARSIELSQRGQAAFVEDRLNKLMIEQGRSQAVGPVATGEAPAQQQGGNTSKIQRDRLEERRLEENRLREEELARQREDQRRRIAEHESIYKPADSMPLPASQSQASAAPKIVAYSAKDGPVTEEGERDQFAHLPDVQIPSGSIISAYLVTGLDAPTGTRAAQQPVPVLMRVKLDTIMPNYVLADIKDCLMLGSAYGELGSQRVNIRGETLSCTLRNNVPVEAKVKFFVTGEDGKNGIKGTLVSRSGQVLAAAAASAITQGILSSLDSSSSENVFLGGSGSSGSSGAISGASEGFDMLTEYYLDIAEQTFPVIEVTNGRWVDIVTTEMLTIKFKG